MSDRSGSELSDVDEFGSPEPQTPTSPRKPSMPPAHNSSTRGTPEPVADLFGSDDDSEPSRGKSSTPPPTVDPDNLFGSDSDASDHDTEEPTVQKRVLSTSIPMLPLPQSTDGRFVVARAPNILQLDAAEFSPETYRDILDEEHKIAEVHGYRSAVTAELAAAAESIITNTVRWRRVGAQRESNARVVRWSDGSTTIVVGSSGAPEYYGVHTEQLKGVPNEKHYYATAAHSAGLGHAHARMSEQWLLRPLRQQSSHARPAVALLLDRVKGTRSVAGASAPVRASRTRFMVVDEAPEVKAKREEEEEERRERQRVREERIRERREARELQVHRGPMGAPEYSDDDHMAVSDDEPGPVRARAARRMPPVGLTRQARSSYVEDEDDDFIVDDDAELEVGPQDEFDDEEDELAAQRLKDAKNASYSSDDARKRRVRGGKSRRQIDLDDDDSEMDDF
ncbi:Paf1 complex component [Coemansia sp. RSA 720]|nr:Paf1 complex component [Coemansia sp. RSA 720]